MYKFFKMTALCAALAAAGAAGAATITLDGTSLSIEDAWKIAAGEADVAIAPEAVKLLEDSHKLVMASAAKGQAVYGLTVGVGLNKDQKLFTADGKLSPEVLEASRAFNYNALRSHSAGVGEMMPVDLARLSMVVRLNTLLAGKSGAQVHVAELYRDMLNKNVTPLIPSEGSVGEADILLASHVGAVMIGEWKADVKGKVMTGADALKAAGIKPLQPEGKDALAILSNNSVAMAYAIDAARNAERIVEMTPTVYGLSLEGLNGNVAPILPQTIGARPFDGLSQTAADMRDVLKGSYLWNVDATRPLQDPLSYRVTVYGLSEARRAIKDLNDQIAVQINSTDDNPATILNADEAYRSESTQVATLSPRRSPTTSSRATASRAPSSRRATSTRCPSPLRSSAPRSPWPTSPTTRSSARCTSPTTSSPASRASSPTRATRATPSAPSRSPSWACTSTTWRSPSP